MNPDMDNREFFSGDDDFTYKIPRVYFQCEGESDNPYKELDYSEDSVRKPFSQWHVPLICTQKH